MGWIARFEHWLLRTDTIGAPGAATWGRRYIHRAFAYLRSNPPAASSVYLCVSVPLWFTGSAPLDMGWIARFGLRPPRARPSSSSTRNAAPRPGAGSDG